LNKRKQVSLEKWLILTGQEKYKISLEHLVVPRCKEVGKRKKKKKRPGTCQKDIVTTQKSSK